MLKGKKLVSSPLDGAAGIEIFRYLIEAGFCLELFVHFLKGLLFNKILSKGSDTCKDVFFFFFSLK